MEKLTCFAYGLASVQLSEIVAESQILHLSLLSHEINDVLKSLLVLDSSDSGRITSVSDESRINYSSEFCLGSERHLGSLLQGLEGVLVRLRTHAGKVLNGSVLGLQKLYNSASEVDTTVNIVLLRDEFAVRHVELLNVADIAVLDGVVRDKMQLSLKESLKAVEGSDRKTFAIHA